MGMLCLWKRFQIIKALGFLEGFYFVSFLLRHFGNVHFTYRKNGSYFNVGKTNKKIIMMDWGTFSGRFYVSTDNAYVVNQNSLQEKPINSSQ
jgi:hypothetical protein